MKKILPLLILLLFILSACARTTIVGEWELYSMKEGKKEIIQGNIDEKFAEGLNAEELEEYLDMKDEWLGELRIVISDDNKVILTGKESGKGTVKEENGKYIFEFTEPEEDLIATLEKDGKLHFEIDTSKERTLIFSKKK